MKKILLIAIFAICYVSVNAQDIIKTKDNTEVLSRVIEIGETSVKYKKWENLSGPTYTMSISKISSIIYQNGSVESFTNYVVEESVVATSIDKAGDKVSSSVIASGNKISRGIDNSVNIQRQELLNQAHQIKVIGWISGLAIIGVGVGVGIATEAYWLCGVGPVVGGLVIGACLGVAGNKERVASSLVVNNLYQHEINDHLSVDICQFNYIPEQSRSFGAGLTFRF